MYADNITKSMKNAIGEVERRRNIQLSYNKKYNKKPIGIQKDIRAKLIDEEITESKNYKGSLNFYLNLAKKEVLLPDEKKDLIKKLRKEMKTAVQNLNFEKAAFLRDQIKLIKIR